MRAWWIACFVVLVAIGLIMGLFYKLLAINVIGGGDRAKAAATKATLSTISTGIAQYQMEFSEPPSTLAALMTSRHLTPTPFVDGWSRPLHYKVLPGGMWRVWSEGPDGIDGTADDL